jgi:probable HAF family extracellular repeat protein
MRTAIVGVSLLFALAMGALFSGESVRRAASCERFEGLGDLAGGKAYSTAKSVSADGTTVVGQSHAGVGMRAFRWTRDSGATGLAFEEAAAVSADGSVVVGYRLARGGTEAVKWTAREGTRSLMAGAGIVGDAANDVSADGETIVGECEPTVSVAFDKRDVAFRWTAQFGFQQLERGDTKQTWSEAHAVSADGAVVVGSRRHRTGHDEAFRWVRESGVMGLGVLPGNVTSVAYAVSADGSVVVGCCGDYLTTEAFRWSRKSGMVSLATLRAGKQGSIAHAVSSDGSIIVGSGLGENGPEAVIWDDVRGVRRVRELLVREFDLGEVLRGWKLRSATAVSADGSIVAGNGVNPDGEPEAWIADIGQARVAVAPLPMIGGPVGRISLSTRRPAAYPGEGR